MTVPRFYIPSIEVSKDAISVSGEAFHRIVDVLRSKKGDSLLVFDGEGAEYICKITALSEKSVSLKIEGKAKQGSSIDSCCRISLIQALPKKSKMDDIIEKATELGISEITPMVTERTIVRPDTCAGQNKLRRWRKIASEAAEQSGRIFLPEIKESSNFKQALKESRNYDMAIIFCIDDSALMLKDILRDRKSRSLIYMIGPEGDFSPYEVAMAKEAGWQPASLGKTVLKVDTAAISALAMLNYEFNIKPSV